MKNILVSMLVNVGDVIMMTSALDLMRQKMAPCKITALIRPEAKSLVENNPVVDDFIIYPYKSGSPLFGLKELRAKIKSKSFNYFLSLDRRPRGVFAAFLSGIKHRIGPRVLFCGSKEKPVLNLMLTQIVDISPEECCGSLVEMFQLVSKRAFGISGSGKITLPAIADEKKAWVREIFRPAQGPVIGFCVRTNAVEKRWGKENFADLIKRLQSNFNAFIYITGSQDDFPYIQEITKKLSSSQFINLAGKTSFTDVRALAAQSDLCIGLDNGAGHLIANSGLKDFICILKATSPKILIDSMPKAHFFSFPCDGQTDAHESHLPRQVEEVYAKAAQLLKANKSSQ